MEGFFIAASNLPGNIFTIFMMDRTGGKTLLCESLVYRMLHFSFICFERSEFFLTRLNINRYDLLPLKIYDWQLCLLIEKVTLLEDKVLYF